MKKVLFVGEHPLGYTGNSGMMNAIASQVDTNKYQFSIFSVETSPTVLSQYVNNSFSIVEAKETTPNGQIDIWGAHKLLQILNTNTIDILVMVGIDIWRYAHVFNAISEIRDIKKFKWIYIFPYELDTVRDDWVELINEVDLPCVYSEYGFNLLKDYVKNLQYFRPPAPYTNVLKKLPNDFSASVKEKIFPNLGDKLLFGFIGINQFRKDPQKLLKAFSIVHKKYPNTALYMHTEMTKGEYNLIQYCKDLKLEHGAVLSKMEDGVMTPSRMVEFYNCFDCFILCSQQEGLSWTVLEAMACGTPVIASEGTAHTELIKDVSISVPRTETAYVPMVNSSGRATYIETKSCSPENIAKGMEYFITHPGIEKEMSTRGLDRTKQWLKGISDINITIDHSTKLDPIHIPINEILYIQHSAAGDLFMSTRCFRGLKERHGDIPLNVMTLSKYMDVVQNNPNVKSVIAWDNKIAQKPNQYYKYVYNPHGDVILPGHWGRNCNSILSDFYWKILKLKPDDFFIEQAPIPTDVEQALSNSKKIAVVQTTGGDQVFRLYKYMKDVCDGLRDKGYLTVQLGGAQDYPAWSDLDLRGKLNFRQSATVMTKASIAVTIDSFIAHLAGAFGVSQVCLFGSGNAHVTRPNQVKNTLICRSPDYVNHCPGLGPCSASKKDCYAKCTGIHNPKDILSDIDELEWLSRFTDNSAYEGRVIFKHENS